jgi:regulator of ribonuclease activity A
VIVPLKCGWEGVIVYGAVRDVDALAQLDLGVQALSPMPLKSVRKGVGDVGLTYGNWRGD